MFLANKASRQVAGGAAPSESAHSMSFLENRYSKDAAATDSCSAASPAASQQHGALPLPHPIQRLTDSNPSPGYLGQVAKPGPAAAGKRTAQYAALGHSDRDPADREARSDVLEADPYRGKLREPIIKVIHFLQSMQFVPLGGREVELWNLNTKIGQEFLGSPPSSATSYPSINPTPWRRPA